MKKLSGTGNITVIRLLFTAALLCSCSNSSNEGKLTELTPGSLVRTAKRFSIEKNDSCSIVTIRDPWQGAKDVSQVYCLVNRNSKPVSSRADRSVIQVPVEKIICMSTTHVAMVSALGRTDALAGISGSDLIFNEEISMRIDSGLINDVGYESGINNELIIRLSPDLIMMYGIGAESAGYLSKAKELGIKVMFNADYLENDPLAKAEWIKLFGALFCLEEKADSIFNSVCESYARIKEYVQQNSTERPSVLLGLPFRDTWFVSPGDSYAARFISDAGGSYLWHDTRSTLSMPYSIEDVFVRSLKADFWLNTGNAATRKEISALDLRLEKVPGFSKGNIYNNNKRVSPAGSNDYWEKGILEPHIILKDIAAILHPELFPEHELYYYRKIE